MEFARFLVVGGTATLLQYILLYVQVEWLGINPVSASACAYIMSALVNYVMNYFFTFKSGAAHRSAGLKFGVVVLIGLLLNTLIVFLVLHLLGLHYLIAQVVATGLVLLWNFFAHKHWTYSSS